MRLSPLSALIIVVICASSLGFAFAARAERAPIEGHGRLARTLLPWSAIMETGALEKTGLAIEEMAFRTNVKTPLARDRAESTTLFADPAAKIDSVVRDAAQQEGLAEKVELLVIDSLNPWTTELMRTTGERTSLRVP